MESIRQYRVAEVERDCLVESFPLKSLGRSARLEVAEVADHRVIVDFICNEFITREPMNFALKTQADGFSQLLNPLLDSALPRKVTVLAIDDGCLCGVFFNNILEAKRTEEWKEPKMKEDYAEEFDAKNIAVGSQQSLIVVLGVVEEYVAQNLPADVDKYLLLDMLSVHRDYVKNGLAKKLIIESCKQGLRLGYKWAQITGSSILTNQMVQAMNFVPIFSLDLKTFRAHGKQVFPDAFHDGGKQIGAYVVETQQIASQYGQ